MSARLVTSPVAGTFVPLRPPPDRIDRDGVVGHVSVAGALVEVRSAFGGRVVDVVASEGQRLQVHERVAWLQVA